MGLLTKMAASAQVEKRSLLVVTIFTILGFVLEIIAVSTNSWIHFDVPWIYDNATGRTLTSVSSGLWKHCKTFYVNTSKSDHDVCISNNLFPTNKELQKNEAMDVQVLDYLRTGSAFAIIALLLMFLGHIFACYTIRRPRYILKRLTALLHIMTAACVLVHNEVFIRTTDYSNENLPKRFGRVLKSYHGYSFALAWLSFITYVFGGIVFLLMSHKRKAEMADTIDALAEEDEPVHIGRV